MWVGFLLAVAFASAAVAQSATGPIASWAFNDGSGLLLMDSSGTRNGAISGASWTPGRYDQALDFPANAFVDLGVLDLPGAFTVMAWMQTRSATNPSCASLVMKALDYGFEICNGRVYAGVGDGTQFNAYVSVPLTAADNGVWKHVAMTYDGTTLRFYVNGVLATSAAGAHVPSSNSLYFGRWSIDQFWDGLIDEVRIYGRVLSVAEIQTDLATPVPNPSTGTAAFRNEIVLASGLNLPTNLAFLPDGSMLIGELGGTIKVMPPGASAPLATPFLALTNIGSTNGQQGLMDIELDPNFASNGFYYVFYTLGTPNRDRVSRFTASGLTTALNSEAVLYQDPSPASAEHHGGGLAILPDGKLYVTTGENFDPAASQDLSNPRGKILRINTDGTVPTDNPFFDGAGPNRDDVFALGLRNPYRVSYDAVSDRLFIGDVGGNDYSTAVEEIDVAVRGANYGWPLCEGPCPISGTTDPLHSYPHLGRDASVTGGFVYRGTQFPPEYRGNYFFGDYTQNWIRRIVFDVNGNVAQVLPFEPPDGSSDGPYGDIVHLSEGPDGSLFYVDLGYSDTTATFGVAKIRRIRYLAPGNLPPVVAAGATPTSGQPPLAVAFSSAGSSDPEGQPLGYAWSFGDGGSATTANPSHSYLNRGRYDARLTVSDGTLSTTSSPVSIIVGNPPSPSISFPAAGSTFRAGDSIAFSGTAVDSEDGVLPASAYSWTVNFLHANHVHPVIPLTGVTQGSFVVPTSGHDFSGNTRYEIRLTVTDSDGIQTSTAVLVYPQKVDLTFTTNPPGLSVDVDGIPHPTPVVIDSLVGFVHTIEGLDQAQGTTAYTFSSWSDAGVRTHDVVTPALAQSFIASHGATVIPQPLAFGSNVGISNDASGATLGATLTNVQAGSLIVAFAKWEGAAGSTVTLSDGTSTFSADVQNDAANGDLHGRFFYLPASVKTGTVIYTASWSQARPFRRLAVYEYRAGGGSVAFDASNRATATTGSLITGNVTTTGLDEIAFGAYGEYDVTTTTGEQIGGLAADQVVRASFVSMWSKRFTGAFTGAATATGNSTPWIGNAIAFKHVGIANAAPTISNIADQTTVVNTATPAIPVTVGDAETPAASLVMTGTSSNPAVVANAGIVYGGSGSTRTVTIVPVANASGTALVTATVGDGTLAASDTFFVTVPEPVAGLPVVLLGLAGLAHRRRRTRTPAIPNGTRRARPVCDRHPSPIDGLQSLDHVARRLFNAHYSNGHYGQP